MNQPLKTIEETPQPNVLAELRKLMPARALRLYEHLTLAEAQATRLHRVLKQEAPAADLAWLASNKTPGITVVTLPRWKMEGLSGICKWTADDGWVIGVNKSNPHARRRFTLAHELKHAIDGNRDKITYRDINPRQREQIADYFAACYLMPKFWLRRAWTHGLQDPEALAGLFKVSLQAMNKRLTYLGYVDAEPDRSITSYFRFDSLDNDLLAG